MECPVFSLAILEILFLEVFVKRIALSVNFLWDIIGTIFLCFTCFEVSHLLVHLAFCYLAVFQRVIECWVVDIFLFLKLFLQVLVYFLQYLDGLGIIQIWCFVLLDWSSWGSHELLLQWSYDSFLCSEMLELLLLTDSQKIYGDYHLRVKVCLLHIL